MEKINQSKVVIYFFSILFLAFSIYLFAIDSNYAKNSNWWVLSFNDPKSDSLNFSIENFSNVSDFHWQIMKNGNEKVSEGDVAIEKESKKGVEISEKIRQGEKITIKVTASETESREIYKQR